MHITTRKLAAAAVVGPVEIDRERDAGQDRQQCEIQIGAHEKKAVMNAVRLGNAAWLAKRFALNDQKVVIYDH